MHPVRKQRLLTVIFIVIASTVGVGLIVYSLSDNMNMFYPPSKILAGEVPDGKRVRAGGCVVPGSVQGAKSSLEVAFDVTDGAAILPVTYDGILPDLFAEGEAAVLTGEMNSGVFVATEVLAKHDETYMPREVSDTLAEDDPANPRNHSKTCEGLDYGS